MRISMTSLVEGGPRIRNPPTKFSLMEEGQSYKNMSPGLNRRKSLMRDVLTVTQTPSAFIEGFRNFLEHFLLLFFM